MARVEANRTAPKLALMASVCVVVAALYFARDVLVPLALAALLSFLLAPPIRWLERHKVPSVPAVLAVVLVAFGLLGGLGWLVTNQIIQLSSDLPAYQTNLVHKIHSIRGHDSKVLENLKETAVALNRELSQPATTQSASQPASQPAAGTTPTPAPPFLISGNSPSASVEPAASGTKENPIWVWIKEAPTNPLWLITNTLSPVLSPLGTAGIVIVFVIFILLDRNDLRDRVLRLVGEGQLHVTTEALDDAGTRISRYLIAQSIVNATYGVLVSVGLWAIGWYTGQAGGFPNAMLWGLFCAVLRFIPYVGPWIGASFPLLLALAAFPSMYVFAATLGLFVGIELLSNNFMEPWLYGSSTGLSAVAVLVSAVFWTWLWGPIGLVLSTPLTSIVVVIGKHVPALGFLDVLLGDEPVFSPPQRLYQRLLASDEDEAAEVAEEYLKDKSLEQLYDDVMLPALAIAEQDQHHGKLDDARRDFVRRAMREMVDDFGDRERVRVKTEAAKVAAADDSAAKKAAVVALQPQNGKKTSKPDPKQKSVPTREPIRRPHLPEQCDVRVTCLPARDEADEIAALMLAQLLNLRGYCAAVASVTSLATEMAQQVETDRADLVVVSALPPAASAHARYLCKRLRQKITDLPIVVGLWTSTLDRTRAKTRLGDIAQSTVEMKLADALDQIHGLTGPKHAEAARPVLV